MCPLQPRHLLGERRRADLRALPRRDFRRPRGPFERRMFGPLHGLHSWEHGRYTRNYRFLLAVLCCRKCTRSPRFAQPSGMACSASFKPATRGSRNCAACTMPTNVVRSSLRRCRKHCRGGRRNALCCRHGHRLAHGNGRGPQLLINRETAANVRPELHCKDEETEPSRATLIASFPRRA